MSRESVTSRLDRLRRRVTLSFALIAAIGLAGLAAITTLVDGQLRADRSDTELQGQAFRSAALVFFDDETGKWNTDGVLDDVVAESAEGILVVDGASGTELVATADFEGADDLVDAVLRDAAETGSVGIVRVDGREIGAAGAPYFGTVFEDGAEVDGVAGAVIVAAQPSSDRDRGRLLAFVWGTTMALIALATAVAWLVAGRVVRPLAAQLDREERFLATAAHELRTPLGRFRAVTESALMTTRSMPDSPERDLLRTDLGRLLELNAGAATSVEDLLLLGRIEAGVSTSRTERVRIDQVAASFESTVPELAVETSEPIEVMGDPTLLHHAISNILVNAQHHGRRADVALTIEASVWRDRDDAVVTVTDNGPGLVDPGQLFQRHSGTGLNGGLGLWIVRTIVEDAGGTASARTAHQRGGAVFELRWPIARP